MCSYLPPTDHLPRASSVRPFEMCAIRTGTRIDSASARSFLSGSPMLSYWCEIAELDLTCVIDRARTLMAGCDAGRRGSAGSAEVH